MRLNPNSFFNSNRIAVVLFFAAVLIPGCKTEKETSTVVSPETAEISKEAKTQPQPQPAPPGKPTRKGNKPNVVVVLLDTVRPDYLEFYGFEGETAPFLASLAKEAVVFENAYSSSSWTAPATASLFTSLYPPQHGVVQGFRAHRSMVKKMRVAGKSKIPINSLPTTHKTLAEKIRGVGYRTYGFAANINIGEEIGFSRGFDVFEKKVKAPAEYFREKLEAMRDEIVGPESPYFLYLHLNDAHSPYDIRQPYYRGSSDKRKDMAARYRSEIGFIDAHLEKIFALFGEEEETVYVILSDHGEEFWDHGGTEHGPQLFRELHHILLMIKAPGAKPQRIAQNTSILDVYPTIVDIVGEQCPQNLEGISLAPLLAHSNDNNELVQRLSNRTLFGHRVFSSKREVSVWAAVSGRWRLIDWWGGRRKLYDEENDPANLFNLATSKSEVTSAMNTRLDAFKKKMEEEFLDAGDDGEITMDESLLERLKSMGYVE